jgi:RNA polymerase sigma-70 factor, ECF subfamily
VLPRSVSLTTLILLTISASDHSASEFEQAFQEYANAIFRHCYSRLNDRARAQEIMQETFMKAWEYLCKGNDIENVKAFLYHAAHNLVINEALKRKRRGDVSLEALQESGFDPGSDKDHEDTKKKIDEGEVLSKLQSVPSPYREALVFRYVDNLSPAEIADVTGESANVVSVRIHRGLQKLRPLLEPEL